MYFKAFDKTIAPSLPAQVTFVLEHLVSQILVSADREFLKTSIENKRLAEALYHEIEFTGQLPIEQLPEVQDYLRKQETFLSRGANQVLRAPDDDALHASLVEPLSMPKT